MQLETPRLISQSELSRILNLPATRVAKAIREGKIKPDAVLLSGRLSVFDSARLDEIRQAITEPEILV